MLDFYWYPKCSTCRKAKQWLDENSIDYRTIDLIQDTPKTAVIEEWLNESDQSLTYFFNTHGEKYRELKLKDELPTMSITRASQVLASDGMLIKRPVLVDGKTITTGFKENVFEETWLKE